MALMDMSDVVASFSSTYSVQRTARGAYVNGAYTGGGLTTVTVRGCAQPREGDTRNPETSGVDIDASMSFYSMDPLTPGTGANDADIIDIEGTPYEVVAVLPWFSLGGYYLATLSRKD